MTNDEAEREFVLAALDLLLRGGAGGGMPARALNISVVVPVFDRAAMIGDALASLERQTWRHFEAIVVDDGSTDGTAEVLARWTERARWLRVLTNPEREGHSRARNRALQAATGDLIVYLDSDNMLYPHALAAIADAFATSAETWSIYTSQLWIGPGRRHEVRCPEITLGGLRAQMGGLDLNAFCHRRELYEVLGGFDERLTRLSDAELMMRYAKLVMPRRVPIPTSHYRDGDWPRASNRALYGWNAHLIRERHAIQVAESLRVLYIVHSYPQVSQTCMVAEYRYMLSRGVIVAIWSETEPEAADPDLPGADPVAIFRGELSEAIADFRPDILHVHSTSAFDRHADTIAASGLPSTIRGHGCDFSPELIDRLQQHPSVRHVYVVPHQYPRLRAANERVRAVASCFDPQMYQPSAEQDRRLVLGTGAALPGKDILSFIDIASRCPEHRFVLFTWRVLGDPGHLDRVLGENERRGAPVEIRIDRPAAEVASWMRRAGIYVHSHDPQAATFDMPISVAEALATGAYVLARRAPNIGDSAGSRARLFDKAEQAALLVNATLDWDAARWAAERQLSIERAFRHHAPTVAAAPILDDWIALIRSRFLVPREATGLTSARVGRSIFFGLSGDGPGMLRTGFHGCEQWGVWSGQREATLAFVTAGPGWGEAKWLSVELSAVPKRVAPFPIRVFLNGRCLGEIEAGAASGRRRLPLTGISPEPGRILHVVFATAPPWIPADTGSPDRRRLGFGLRRLSLDAASAE